MKNLTINFKRTIALLILMVGMGSCEKYMDLVPKDQVTDGTVWATASNADMFLNTIYGALPTPYRNEDPDENRTDHSLGKPNNSSTRLYKKSAYTAQSPGPANLINGSSTYTLWNFYNTIRKANLFIQNVTASTVLSDSYKKSRLAEVRFLRAYYYMLLWTHYGGVPVITDVLNISEQGDAVFRPRNTDAETYQFIVAECAAVAPDLPNAQGNGRATRGAALTLKAWCELWNASPLKNPSNDLAKWTLAAATYKQVMDLGTYTLFPNYETMLYEANEKSSEVIFAKEHLGGVGSLGSHREGQWGPFKAGGSQQSWCGVNPTQDIVDAYRMSNGKLISDPSSGYNPQNPYVNREKRFYSSIIYDGSIWLGSAMVMKQGVGSENATDINNSSDATNTGYYLRKSLEERNAFNGANNRSGADFQIFRYGEVLLAYAEAQNEAVGPDQSVYDAVNKVKARSELPPLPSNLSKAQMRDAIQQERRVELFFEEKRWYDLIRLKTAETILNGTSKAMRIDQVSGKWVYKVINAPAGAMVFNAGRDYYWPIPQSAIDRNDKLTQNPLYD